MKKKWLSEERLAGVRVTAIFGSVSIMITPLQATALVKDEESGNKHR
jgi:hypothetical protein